MEVASYYLDGNADAAEFCPHHPFHHILAAATYTLQEGDQPSRSGSISLFSIDDDVAPFLLYRTKTAGVFDIKWNPCGGVNLYPLLAQADADGCLKIHALESNLGASEFTVNAGFQLKEVGGEKLSSSMCLCLDWDLSATSISVGLSDGSISIATLREAQVEISQSWEAHKFEVWATFFDTQEPHLLYTGSDDCKFCCWDLRESPSKLVFQNTNTHKMGVCSISKSASNSNITLTGCYDEFLRVWDVRSTNKPVNEKSICLGGGVWKVKPHPYIPDLVLAACMHNGFAVVSTKGENIEVIETYSKHGSLAYGADWQRGGVCSEGGSKRTLVATCSFYDRLLRIWHPESLTAK